jgi:hypothetical protein
MNLVSHASQQRPLFSAEFIDTGRMKKYEEVIAQKPKEEL